MDKTPSTTKEESNKANSVEIKAKKVIIGDKVLEYEKVLLEKLDYGIELLERIVKRLDY